MQTIGESVACGGVDRPVAEKHWGESLVLSGRCISSTCTQWELQKDSAGPSEWKRLWGPAEEHPRAHWSKWVLVLCLRDERKTPEGNMLTILILILSSSSAIAVSNQMGTYLWQEHAILTSEYFTLKWHMMRNENVRVWLLPEKEVVVSFSVVSWVQMQNFLKTRNNSNDLYYCRDTCKQIVQCDSCPLEKRCKPSLLLGGGCLPGSFLV